MYKRMLIVGLLIMLLIPLPHHTRARQNAETITLVTHDSFSISEEVLTKFEETTGISVQILRSGDAGSMVNQSILSRTNPLGDVMYGIDNTFLTRALDADLFEPYETPYLDEIPEEFIIDSYVVTPIDYGDVCLNYDAAYFAEQDLELPKSLSDLTEPEYEGMLVVENPATSSPGLAFLLATISEYGISENETEADDEYTYLDYWQELVTNDVLVVDDWTDAYYGQFSATGDGTRPLVVSYASSPPAEVYFATEELDTPPTGTIIEDGMCFRQIEYAGILRGTQNVEAAQMFIDFMLSSEFQQDLPLQMFVFPVVSDTELPEVFATYAEIPENPVELTHEEISVYREEQLQAWVETILR